MVTEAEKEYVLNNSEKSAKVIASILNCSESKILKIKRSLGIVDKRKDNHEKIVKYVKEHYNIMTNKEMADNLNVYIGTIEKIKQKYKLYTRGPNSKSIYISDIILKDDEEFRNMKVIGFSRYSVSNYGNVVNDNDLVMKHQINSDNYHTLCLTDDNGVLRTVMVHILVAKMFIPNPENKPQVNHIQPGIEGKNNLSVSNLEWVTQEENMKHAREHGLIYDRHDENNPATKYNNEQIKHVCELFQEGKSIEDIINIMSECKFEKYILYGIYKRKTWNNISKNYIW